jgi:hypothetical protein
MNRQQIVHRDVRALLDAKTRTISHLSIINFNNCHHYGPMAYRKSLPLLKSHADA